MIYKKISLMLVLGIVILSVSIVSANWVSCCCPGVGWTNSYCTTHDGWADCCAWTSGCSGDWSPVSCGYDLDTCCSDSDCGLYNGWYCRNHACVRGFHAVDSECCTWLSSSHPLISESGYYYRKCDAWCTASGAWCNCNSWTSNCDGRWYDNTGFKNKVDCCKDSDCPPVGSEGYGFVLMKDYGCWTPVCHNIFHTCSLKQQPDGTSCSYDIFLSVCPECNEIFEGVCGNGECVGEPECPEGEEWDFEEGRCVETQPVGTQTCAELGGKCCRSGQICQSVGICQAHFIDSSDCGWRCCDSCGECAWPPTKTCAELGGTCKDNSCDNYNDCSSLAGTCASGYCCKGACTEKSGECGNGIINTGETCDGTEWGPITGCSNFDEFTGGSLSCVNCKFDTSACTGGTAGSCGDGVINTGETCDGTEWGPITGCSNFDEFTGGSLSCVNCKFDTSQCTKGEPCEFTSSAWSSSEVADGTNVGLNVQGNGFCNGKSVKFEVFENELVGRNPAQTNPVNVVFNGNTATGTWTAEWIDDGFAQGNPEYVFKASLASDSNIFIDNSGELTVLPDGGFGGYCGDGVINTGETCDGTEWGPITGCSNFDEFTGGSLSCVNCKFDTSACTGGTAGSCGDGVINTGETCDGTEWGPITGCSNFDEFTGGSLSCVNCKFDTSQCTGGFGIYCLNITSCSNYLTSGECSADACDVAEASVEANNPLITCGEAGVSCECAWVSNICEPSYTSVAGGYIIGTCSYDESTDDDCEDGFLSYNWIATWTWGHDGWVDWNNGPSSDVNDYELDAGKYYYDPDSKFDDCQDGSTLVECPASIQVGFFGVWNFIIAVIILGVIYWMWNLRKKKTSKKKK